MRRYENDTARLYLDLATALRDVTCARIQVGSYLETLDEIERLTGGRS